MSESTMVILFALLCAVISLAGLASVVSWGYIWRSCLKHRAARLANTGMKENFIQALPLIIYGKSIRELPGISIATDCAICLAEFVEGEGVRMLPSCNHCFHKGCTDKWLRSHSTCPTCKLCLHLHGCKNMANQCTKSNDHGEQIQQPTASQETHGIRDIIRDIESGTQP